MDSPLISVIIPVYNIEPYIARCLDSVLAQTYPHIEIIAVNDGSKDHSGEILDSYEKSYPNVRVIHKENGGVTRARITGVEAAAGEYIGFVDGDDIIEADMYERLMDNMLKYGADISHCGYQMVFPDRIDYYYNTGLLAEQDNTTALKELLCGSRIEPGLCNKLFHKTLFQSLLHDGKMDYSIKINEDLLMNYWLFKEAKSSVFEDICPYHYMIRKGSAATSQLNENKLSDPLRVLWIILNDCNDIELERVIKSRISTALISLVTLQDGAQHDLIAPYRNQARKELRELCPEILRGAYSKRTKVLTALATISPWLYRNIHSIYARLKGTDQKYRVE